PEQAVEVDDVLADEVVQFGVRAGPQQLLERGFVEAGLAAAAGQREQAGEVADRRVEPDVEVLARMAGDLEAEVGRVAGNVPVAQAALGVDPFTQLGLDAGDGDFALQPVAQHRGEVADLEEEMRTRAARGWRRRPPSAVPSVRWANRSRRRTRS